MKSAWRLVRDGRGKGRPRVDMRLECTLKTSVYIDPVGASWGVNVLSFARFFYCLMEEEQVCAFANCVRLAFWE